MKSTPTIQSIIKTHLESGNTEYLEPALLVGYDQLPRTDYYNRLLNKGFLFLSNDYIDTTDLFSALIFLEYARKLTPYDTKVVKKEFTLLERIFDLYYPDFVKRDVQLFRGIIQVLESFYEKRFPNLVKIIQSITYRAGKLIDTFDDAVEGKYSYRIEKIFCNLYNDLTPEEQAELFAEIIAPEILREIGEKIEKEKNEDVVENEVKMGQQELFG